MDVEAGRPISVALARFPKLFTPVYVNMVSAGEASGNMGLAFDRLTKLMRQQQEIRNRVIGALAYPAGLVLLCTAVIAILFTFVLPRFEDMFTTVGVPLPMSTRVLLTTSKWCVGHWALLAGGPGASLSPARWSACPSSGGLYAV
jgi:type II secretory pathway component PulF